jgi:hypothetical protein
MVEFKDEEIKRFKDFLDFKEKSKELEVPKPIIISDNIDKGFSLTPISDWCKHYAVIFDDAGHYLAKVKIKYTQPAFTYKEHAFNFKPNETSFFKIKTFWNTKKYYAFNINNPDGIIFKSTGIESVIDSKTYKSILENTLVQQLNDLADSGFMAFLKKYWWLILIILLAIGIYFYTGHGGTATPEIVKNTTAVVKK